MNSGAIATEKHVQNYFNNRLRSEKSTYSNSGNTNTTKKSCSLTVEKEKYEAGDWETVSEASDVSEDAPTYSFETISKEQQMCLQHEALRFLGEHGKELGHVVPQN